MANYHTLMSSMLYFKQKSHETKDTVAQLLDGYIKTNYPEAFYEPISVGYEAEPAGVWFYNEVDGFDSEQLEELVRFVMSKVSCKQPFECSFSYTCSKPRLDAFGGAALIIHEDLEDAIYISPEIVAQTILKEELKKLKDKNNDAPTDSK
jgi:hypothetical protein